MKLILPGPLRGMRAALVFLTRLPVGGFPYRSCDWRWAPAHFPFAGAVVGGLLALIWLAAAARAGPLASASVVVALSLLVTGAFHEDGLADTADALGGAQDRPQIFIILKDSRIGTFGACALALALILRVVLLAELAPFAPAALIATQCAARAPPVWLQATLPYAGSIERAKSQSVIRAGVSQAMVATVWPVILVAVLVVFDAIELRVACALIPAGLAAAAICAWRFWVRAGGVNGDFLGALEQICECSMLLGMVLVK